MIALLDACTLYPLALRDLLMWLATARAYQPCWTDAIHTEWIRSVLANRRDVTPDQLERSLLLMKPFRPILRAFGMPTFTFRAKASRHTTNSLCAIGWKRRAGTKSRPRRCFRPKSSCKLPRNIAPPINVLQATLFRKAISSLESRYGTIRCVAFRRVSVCADTSRINRGEHCRPMSESRVRRNPKRFSSHDAVSGFG